MTETFGGLLMTRRCEAGKSLRAFATALGVSAPYLSDVENNRRPPFRPELVVRAALALGADPKEFLSAAFNGRPPLVDVKADDQQLVRELGVALYRRQLSTEKLREVLRILEDDVR